MSLAVTQQVSSAASLSTPVNEPVFAPLHVHLNYGADTKKTTKKNKKPGVCLSRWAKSILMKETVGRVWDFNHGGTEPPRSSQVPVISVQHLTEYKTLMPCGLYHKGNEQVGNKSKTNLIFSVTFRGNRTLLVGSVLTGRHKLGLKRCVFHVSGCLVIHFGGSSLQESLNNQENNS